MTGAFLMSTKNVCAGAILSVLLLWGIVHFLPAGKVRVAPGPPAGGSTRAVENAARLPERTAAVDGVLPVESGAQPSPSSGEDGGLQAVSLEGKITSTSGEPVAGARVMALERKAWDEALRADMPEGEEGPLGVLQRTSEKARQAASRVPRVETAADGTYVFRGLDPGDYQVLAAHPEYLPRQDAWAIVEPERTARADIILDPAQVLGGKVVDASGEPVAGAIVRARSAASRGAKGMGKLIAAILESTDGSFLLESEPARTDAAGVFRITALEPVLQDITAMEERRGRGESHSVSPGKMDCVIALARGLAVAGRVLTPAGEPVAGAQVALGEPETSLALLNEESLARAEIDVLGETTRRGTTGEDGRFRLSVFGRGDMELRVRAPRYLERVDPVRVDGSSVDLGDLALEEPFSIAGVVLSPGGAPVEGARVSAREPGKPWAVAASDDTDSRGRFALEGLAAEPYELEARAAGFPAARLAAVQSGGDPLEIRLEKGLAITGLVLDARNRTPVAGARISDTGGRAAAVITDETGRFDLVGAEGAPGALEVSHESYATWTGQAGPEPVEVLLREARGIHGTVLGPDSKPLRNVRVALEVHGMPPALRQVFQHFKTHLRIPPALSAEDGSFFLRVNDWDEPCLVVASAPGYARARIGPLDPPGAREDWPRVDVRLGLGSCIEGEVSRSTAGPLPGARVLIRSALQSGPQAKVILDMVPVPVGDCVFSAADGSFKIDRVEEGVYEVEVSAVGFARKTIASFPVGKGPARLDVVLDEGGSIEGKVVDPRGNPLRGIELVALLDNGAMDFGDARPEREASMRRFDLAGGMGVGSTKSDADGKFLFERLPEGPFCIVARAPGFEPAAAGPLKPGERADLILLAEARLSGDVRDAETQLPVAGFGLKLSPAEASDDNRALESGDKLTLDPVAGSFLYTGLPPGDYVLLVHADGYAPFRGAVKLGPGETGSVAVLLDHGLRVSGVVRSSSTRAPIAGAEIVAVPGAEEERRIRPRARSDEDGRFLLQGLAAGEYELVAAHPDFIQTDEDRTRKMTLPLDAERDLELRLDPAGRLEGRVTNLPALSQGTEEWPVLLLTRLPKEDRPVDGASNVRQEKCRWALPLDSSGRYSAVSLRPGTYRLELMQTGGREATFSLKMALAGQQPLEPGRPLGETEVSAGETAKLDAAVR